MLFGGSERLQGTQEEAPSAGPGARGLVEPELQLDIHEARGMLGALEIATHPVEAVGYALKHDRVTACFGGEKVRSRHHEATDPRCDWARESAARGSLVS